MRYDDPSGVTFHYDSRLRTGVGIVVSPGAEGEGTSVSISGAAMQRFIAEVLGLPQREVWRLLEDRPKRE